MNRQKFRLAAAAVSALAIGLLGTGAPAAFADATDPTKVDGVSQVNTSNGALVNPTATVQLEIHKYLGAPVAGYGNGTEVTGITLPALSGVQFDVYQVCYDAACTNEVDLTTNDGWAAASAITGKILTQAEITAKQFTIGGTNYYLGTPTPVTTTAPNGVATFTKTNGVGFYLVNENVPASTNVVNLATNAAVPTLSITPTAPFFVTLPMTNPSTPNQWMYDVDVYPKNQSDTATKAVVAQGTNTSENGNTSATAGATYTITTGITDGLTGPQMGMYVVYDNLDPRLDFTSASVALSGTTPPALVRCTAAPVAPATTPALAPTDCDYTVWVGAEGGVLSFQGTDATVTGGPIVQIVFTDAGLAKLAANSSATVVTTINTTVNAEGTTGVIPNSATFIPNQGSWEANPGNFTNPENPGTTAPPTTPTTGSPSTTTQLKYGDLTVNKQDPLNTAASMTGAEFAIYADPTPGDDTCSATDVAGTPIKTMAIVSGNTLTFKGLETSDFYLNALHTVATEYKSYCLVETKAPTGYNLSAQPEYVTIMSTTATASAPAVFTITVNNEKSNLGNNLPLTGGEGVAALSLGGLVLIGGGAGYYAYTSRKRRTA